MNEVRIEKLINFPEMLETVVAWAFDNWYLGRNIPYIAVFNDYKKRMNDDHLPVTYLSFLNDKLCGMVSLKKNDLISRRDLIPWLSSLYVLPEFRRKGVGSSLIKTAISEAGRFDFKKIFLFADHRNEAELNTFYKHLGWDYFCKSEDSDGNTVNIFYRNIKNSA